MVPTLKSRMWPALKCKAEGALAGILNDYLPNAFALLEMELLYILCKSGIKSAHKRPGRNHCERML